MPDLVLLHFDEPYQHARHYLGYAVGTGRGRHYYKQVINGLLLGPHELVMAVQCAEIPMRIAEVWEGEGRDLQRKLRRQGGLSRHCRFCRESGNYHR